MSARVPFTLVDVFSTKALHGASVAVSMVSDELDAALPAIASTLGASATVFVLPPRRDDCEHRLRVFTPRRELPLSARGALAAAAVIDNYRSTFEQGVTRTTVQRDRLPDGTHVWTLPLARPVLGQLPLHGPALVAAALGLAPEDLAGELPILSASCGVLMVVVPLRTGEALARAALQPALWQQVVEKAKPYGALLVVPSTEGPVAMRCLTPGPCTEDQGTGLGCASLAAYLVRHRLREAAFDQRVAFEQPLGGGRVATIHVAIDGAGDRDDAVRVSGAVTACGEGLVRR